MTGAGEVFTIRLARTSSPALQFLRSRDLTRDDKDDILAEAMAWCWAHRNEYSLVTTLETWFSNAVRDAYKKWKAGETRGYSASLADVPTGDTTLANAEVRSAAQAILRALPRVYRRVVWLEMQGYTHREMRARGIADHVIKQGREQIKQLRRLLPAPHEYVHVIRAVPIPPPDETDANDAPYVGESPSQTQWGTLLGDWAQQQTTRTVKGARMFGPLETYYSRMRERLNRRAGLDPKFMPDYVPTKHWRQ